MQVWTITSISRTSNSDQIMFISSQKCSCSRRLISKKQLLFPKKKTSTYFKPYSTQYLIISIINILLGYCLQFLLKGLTSVYYQHQLNIRKVTLREVILVIFSRCKIPTLTKEEIAVFYRWARGKPPMLFAVCLELRMDFIPHTGNTLPFGNRYITAWSTQSLAILASQTGLESGRLKDTGFQCVNTDVRANTNFLMSTWCFFKWYFRTNKNLCLY